LAPNTCEHLKKICNKIGEPEKPIPKPDLDFISAHLVSTTSLYDPRIHKVPDIEYFNKKLECKEQETCKFEGGETKALQLFKLRIENEKETFKQGKLNPNIHKDILFTKEISLSPYLRFGCLSVRKFYWDLKKAFQKVELKIK
jgi:cryptochrome